MSHVIYLESKDKKDNSISRKRLMKERMYNIEPQGSRVMVKAILLKIQSLGEQEFASRKHA